MLRNIAELDFKVVEGLSRSIPPPDAKYEEYTGQLKASQPAFKFKVLEKIPKSVLTEVNQLDRSCFSQSEGPVLIEFALRYTKDNSLQKLVTVPSEMTIGQLRTYILYRIIP